MKILSVPLVFKQFISYKSTYRTRRIVGSAVGKKYNRTAIHVSVVLKSSQFILIEFSL